MSEPKKTKFKAIADVAHPGKSAPSDTSKSIITHRPIMKDPMVVEGDVGKPDEAPKQPLSKAGETKIEPLKAKEEPEAPKAEKKSETAGTLVPKATDKKTDEKPDKEPDTESKPEEQDGDTPADTEKTGDDKADTDKGKKNVQSEDEAKAAAQAEQDAKLQKIIDSKKYFLPINAVEQRRSKRFVGLGIFLALVLAVAWADVALDAGLIQIGSIKPVTHFFSN